MHFFGSAALAALKIADAGPAFEARADRIVDPLRTTRWAHGEVEVAEVAELAESCAGAERLYLHLATCEGDGPCDARGAPEARRLRSAPSWTDVG